MDTFKRIYQGWKSIASRIIVNINLNLEDMLWIIPLFLGVIFIGIFIQIIVRKKIRKKRYLINKHHVKFVQKLKVSMLKYHYSKKLIDVIALRICIFNDRSFETNRGYSAVVVMLSIVFVIKYFSAYTIN